jgi:hypothetical protein
MGKLTIVNPVAQAQVDTADAERIAPAKRPPTLEGRTVGLYWNGKNLGDIALARARENLAAAFPGVEFLDVFGEKGGLNRYLSPAQLEMMARECDAAIGTTADCGSCTSWLMRDMVELERRGVPTAAYTAQIFDDDAHWSAKTFGLPELPIVLVPQPFTNRTPAAIRRMVDDSLPRVIEALTRNPEPCEVLPQFSRVNLVADPELYFAGDGLEAFDRMNAEFVRQGWSDGLPLVPPTPEKVEAMIRAAGRDGDELVGVFAPGNGLGTVRKIAANAVMAGCKPETMPIVLAMLECVLDPAIGLRTWSMSTGPQAPLVMVSGPLAREIGMNSGVCALGPASISQVNVSIGRALRLIMLNVGHSYPGVGDMDTIGSAMKFGACVAENEARCPWPPYRVQQGYSLDDTTVTVTVPYGVTELFDFQNHDPELLVENFATVASNSCGSPNAGVWLVKSPADLAQGYPFHGTFQNTILLCPEHAEVFGAAGWTPRDVKEALFRRTRLSFRKLMLNQPMRSFEVAHPELRWLEDAPDTEISVFPTPDCFELFVVGGDAGRSLYHFGGTLSVTRPVRR